MEPRLHPIINPPSVLGPEPEADLLPALKAALSGSNSANFGLPDLSELTAALTALAGGTKQKVLLPLGENPGEFALVRQGESVFVSFYETGGSPEVHFLDHPVDLARLLEMCTRATIQASARIVDPVAREISIRLAERATQTLVTPRTEAEPRVWRRGGYQEPPPERIPLGFGFEVGIQPGTPSPASGTSPSDIHAMLFGGTLWAYVRGRRLALAKGPIMLVVQRMVTAVGRLVDAWDHGKAANVRLHSGMASIGLRLGRDGETTISLGNGTSTVTAAALEVPQAGLPVLRLATDLLRTLVTVDRAQSRNLRVRSLREEVRSLRRMIRNRDRQNGFVNRDPDRLRSSATPPVSTNEPAGLITAAPSSLRFAERWRLEIDGIDAASTFFCGDRLLVATPRHTLAIERNSGEVLWVREGIGVTSMMAGTTLLRIGPEGHVELCDVETGEAFASTRIAPRVGAPPLGISAGGGAIPPVAILTEAGGQLVAIDLRHGEPRWRFHAQRDALPRLTRAGRVLIVVCGDGSVHALDVATGEVVWRFSERERFVVKAAVCREVVFAASGEPGARDGTLFGIDLFSGQHLWSRPLGTAPTTAPIGNGLFGIVPTGSLRHGTLQAFEPNTGELQWELPDPGINSGGATLTVDRQLVINAPAGRVTSIDTQVGRVSWTQRLADPLADVPRRLGPVLRGGALFVPASRVHVLKVHDGSPIGEPLPCELIPDAMRVDERSWVYVAEESGFLAACAPVPHLRLVK